MLTSEFELALGADLSQIREGKDFRKEVKADGKEIWVMIYPSTLETSDTNTFTVNASSFREDGSAVTELEFHVQITSEGTVVLASNENEVSLEELLQNLAAYQQ